MDRDPGANVRARGFRAMMEQARLHSHLVLLAVFAGSISVAACVAPPASRANGVQAGDVDRPFTTSPLVGQAEALQASSQSAAQADVPLDQVSSSIPGSVTHPSRKTGGQGAGTRSVATSSDSGEQADGPAPAPSLAGTSVSDQANLPITSDAAAKRTVGDEASYGAKPAEAIVVQTSFQPVLWAFLAGLLIGLMATMLVWRRRRVPQPCRSLTEDTTEALWRGPLHDDAHQHAAPSQSPPVQRAHGADQASRPLAESDASGVPSAAQVAPISDTLACADPAQPESWAIEPVRVQSWKEPQVEIIPHAAEVTITPPATKTLSDPYSPARDLRRARLLRQQGELEQALSTIEPLLRDLGREGAASASDEPERLPPGLHLADQDHPLSRALAAFHADLRWEMALSKRRVDDYVQATSALQIYLAIRPNSATARMRLGYCLLNRTGHEADEMTQAALLRSCIDVFSELAAESVAADPLLLGMLGEAQARMAMLEPALDVDRLAEAESLLRQALAMGATDDSQVAWWLQSVLAAPIPVADSDASIPRLQESMALLRSGLSASHRSPASARWQAALLRAELEALRRASMNTTARRLSLRDLHARHVEAMRAEQSPEVLAAWVDVLCALAEPLVGSAALERYREVDAVLERLAASDPNGRVHAGAWMQMMDGRLRLESEAGKHDLLTRAETVLEPCLDEADARLRLRASELALTLAEQVDEPATREQAYRRALELVRPLTAVPSLAVPALGCAIKASLAVREDKERRVYAKCLRAITDYDAASLGVLATSAYQDSMFAETCRYIEQISSKSIALPDDLLELWRAAHKQWAEQGAEGDPWKHNGRQLRMALGRRRA